jgi:hypothetical protein
MRYALSPALLAALLGVAAQPALTLAARAQSVTIDLTFSEKAQTELTSRGEGVAVAGYWSGEPLPGSGLPEGEPGGFFLLSETVVMQAVPSRVVLGANYASVPIDRVTEPQLNVSVYTDRWTDEYNLIDCGFLDAPVAELAAAPQKLHCTLIGE